MQGTLLLLGLVIYVAGWLVSGHFPPWPSFQQQWFSALGVSIMALGAAWRRGPWRWPTPAVAMLALATVPLVQFGFGQVVFLSDAVVPALFVVAFALSIAVAANLPPDDSTQWPDSLMVALLTAAVASTGLAATQWLQFLAPVVPLDPMAPGGRPYANLAQPNHLATLLGLGIASTLYLFERRRLSALAAGSIAAWLGFGLLMTQSRTGWLFLMLLVPWWFAGRRYLRLRFEPLAVAMTVFAAGVWQWTHLNHWLLLTDPRATLDQRLNTDLRANLWRAMFEAVGNSPWVGWGWNQVVFGHTAVAYEHDAGQRVFQNAHNIVLDLMLWMGIPLAVVVVSLAGYWLWRQVRDCRDGARWALLLAVGAIGVHAFTEYPLDYAYFLFTLGLLIGTLQALEPVGRSLSLPRATFILPWAACLGMMFWIGVEYMQVEEAARRVRMVLSGVGIDKVSYAPPPDVWLLDGPREYHRFVIFPVRRGMSEEELRWMRDVAQRNPFPGSLRRLALADALNGHGAEAARALQALCHLHPPARCDETREYWRVEQQRYPELLTVPPP